MKVKFRFLGALSVKYGSLPVTASIDPDYESLNQKIREMIGSQNIEYFVILRNGKQVKPLDSIEDGDEFCVFTPISGG